MQGGREDPSSLHPPSLLGAGASCGIGTAYRQAAEVGGLKHEDEVIAERRDATGLSSMPSR
jgi:hypothetical protein